LVRKRDPSVESKEVVKMVGKQAKQDRGARKEPEDRERPNACRPLMNVRTVLALTLLVAVTTFGAGVALATTGSGFIERTVIARGTLAPQFKIKLRDSSSPGDVVIQKFVLAPGGQSGWHLHPGPAVVTVKSGEFTLDQEDCSSATYSAGQSVVEPTGHVHRVRNVGATNLEFWVAFLDIPVGSPQRIEPEIADPDWVEPAC
jgi:quercetin dioxygenase-like cupin family protein